MSPVPRIEDAATIERDIAQTRQRLSHDLAMLDREYAVRNMFVHALRFAHQGKSASSLAASAKRNALPLGLIGIGLTWIAFADPDRAMGRRLRDAFEQTWRLLETVVGGTAVPTAVSSTDKPEPGESS